MTERIAQGAPGQFARRAGLALALLGAFLAGAALMLSVVYHRVAVLPLNTYVVTRLHATGATYFDPAVLRTRTGLNVTATSTLRGDVRAARGDTAVYDTFLAVQAAGGIPIEYVQTRAALDRRTGLLVNCCGAHVGADAHVHESGLGFKFPFFARKTTYQVFDADVRRAVPAGYAGQASIDGMTVYRYVQVLPRSGIGYLRVPPSVMGMAARAKMITVRRLEATTTTFWVDPVTGVPMKVGENTRQYLQNRNGRHTRLVFAADFRQNAADVAAAVSRYRGQSRELALLRGGVPAGAGVLGAALIAIGAVTAHRGDRRRARPGPAEPARGLTTARTGGSGACEHEASSS